MRLPLLLLLLVPVSPGWAMEQIVVTTQACRRVLEHVPSKDVEYKPGVDVRGRAVAPADLDGGYANILPPEITLHIGIDLADRLGRRRAKGAGLPGDFGGRPTRPYEGIAELGIVTVKGNRLYWNDEPLQTDDETALAAACRTALSAAEVPPPKPPAPTAR